MARLRPRVLRQVALTMFREFIRSKEAVFWTYAFPVLMAMVLGLAFGTKGNEPSRVAIVESASAAGLLAAFDGAPTIDADVRPRDEADRALRASEVDLVIAGSPGTWEAWFDEQRAASRLARFAVEDILSPRERRPADHAVHKAATNGDRYIDFLIPGLIGLNLLGAGMWGIGFNLVHLRIKNMMRRLIVAPMEKAEFLLAFLVSRLGLVVLDALVIVAFGMLVFDVPVNGSWFLLIGLIALGAMSTTALGLVVASRPTTTEGVSGIMNLVTLPMWLMGGSFFATSYFPDYFRPLVNAMPLTHINDALRAVMIQGADISTVWPQVAFLAVFTLAGFTIALRIFRWT